MQFKLFFCPVMSCGARRASIGTASIDVYSILSRQQELVWQLHFSNSWRGTANRALGHSCQKGGTRDGQFGTPCPLSTIIKARRSPLRRSVLRAEEERPAVVVIVLRLLLFHRMIVERGDVSGPLGRRWVAVPGWSARAGRLAGRTLGRPLLGIWVGGRLVAFARRLVALCVLSDRLLVALVIGWAKGWA
jgi:hypothetical protein